MERTEHHDATVRVYDEGYLRRVDDWNEEVAWKISAPVRPGPGRE